MAGRYNNGSQNTARKQSNNKADDQKKSSGCKAGIGPKSGKPWVSGWNFQKRRGMLTFIAGPYEGTSVVQGKTHEWENWVAKLKLNGIPQPGVMPCLYDVTTGKVIFKDLDAGMVANPKAPNGGYFGTFNK